MYTKAFISALLIGFANSAPIVVRQTATTSKEFSQGGCRAILFAYARGTSEAGNMGSIGGPQTSNALKQTFGSTNVATEGIDYAATLTPNILPGGTDAASKQLMQNTLNAMAAQCPDSIIVTGGYSQGAAVNHRAIESLSAAVKNQIAGVVTYGDTQKQQDNNQIPNFPANKVLIICQPGDLVCNGTLTITAAHLTYATRAAEGAAFLAQKIRAVQAAIKATKVAEEALDAANIVKKAATALAI